MESLKIAKWVVAGMAAACLAILSGCGSKSTANVITVTVTSSNGTSIIVGSSTTLTATVTGATNLGVNWETPQYTTTTFSNGKPTTSTPQNIPSDGSLGGLSNQTTTSPATATYTAPAQVPDQTKFPGLAIIITAQSQQDTKKTGKITLALDSGIIPTLTPTNATVPTNEQQSFTVTLTNDLQNQGVTWLLTQQSPTSTTTEPNLTTCSPGCGTLTNTGLLSVTYVAPSAVPTATTPSGASTTPASLTIVATAKADNTRFATGTITIIQGGPISFNGITPTIAPQGATVWDLYLDAPNISSASKITITDQFSNSKTFASTDVSNQIKVLFPIPTSTTPNPASTGARLRLLESDLSGAISANSGSTQPLVYTVTISDPAECGTPPGSTPNCAGSFSFTLQPVRPTSIASVPDDVVQGATSDTNVTVDGGYFGETGKFASLVFQGNTLGQRKDSHGTPLTTSRQLFGLLPANDINPLSPGLYPLSVVSASPVPLNTNANNPAITNIALFPDYQSAFPTIVGGATGGIATAGKNPSAIDIDPTLGVIVVADTGSNQVEFYSIGSGALTLLGTATVAQLPTGLSVDRTNHTAAVVSYGNETKNGSGQFVTANQTVTVLPIPTTATTTVTPLFTVDLSGLLSTNPPSTVPLPLPYAIGVDPDTNLALVAYSFDATNSFGNLGFIVNLNQGANPPFGCNLQNILNGNSNNPTGPCLSSQTTLNTGANPQIAMAPHGHTAYVTPGGLTGSNVIHGVDVSNTSATSVVLSNVTLTSGGTVTATLGNDPSTGKQEQLTGLVPGVSVTALISNVPAIASAPSLNGMFSINVTSNTTFTYFVGTTTASGTVSAGTASFGTSNVNFAGLPVTSEGIAINPITHTAALADAGATGGPSGSSQINLLNQLDQSVNSIRFSTTASGGTTVGCTAYTTNCSGGAELFGTLGIGTTAVAWQPYTNELLSYNGHRNELSISDPVTQQRYAIAAFGNGVDAGETQLTVQNGTSGHLTIAGGVVVDPATNQAFVTQPAANVIQIVNLGPGGAAIKSVHITEVVVPPPPGAPAGSIGGVPNAFLPQGTLTSASDLTNVQIFGSGFDSGTQVRLDGTAFASSTLGNFALVSSRQLTVTIPKSFLSVPHRFALDVMNGSNVPSNATDFIVVQSIDMTQVCATPQPSSVAIADQLKEMAFAPIAVVSNGGCNNISVIDINPASPTFGTVKSSIAVGKSPEGVAVSAHLGLAVVANNGDGTVSVVDLTTGTQPVAAVTTGTTPMGVAINDATGAALVANFGSNTVSEINLGLLAGSSPATSLSASTIGGVQQPIAVAIDPDRGTNNQGLAVVTALQLISGSSPIGALYPVDIGLASPSLSTAVSISSVNATPTGIVFDPAVSTNTQHPGVFYVNASGSNQIYSYNPDTGGASPANVGINPTGLAVNPQTGAILTTNFVGQSISIVDTLSGIKTRQTFGLSGSAQFGVAIDQFTNMAVIVDQANNRVLLFAMPN